MSESQTKRSYQVRSQAASKKAAEDVDSCTAKTEPREILKDTARCAKNGFDLHANKVLVKIKAQLKTAQADLAKTEAQGAKKVG